MEPMVTARAGERGAITIKTLLTFILVGVTIFSAIKIMPVYAEQRQLIYEVDELANKAAVRNLKEPDLIKAIESLRQKYELPEECISLAEHGPNKARIKLTYTRPVNFLVTTYEWRVDHLANGKAI